MEFWTSIIEIWRQISNINHQYNYGLEILSCVVTTHRNYSVQHYSIHGIFLGISLRETANYGIKFSIMHYVDNSAKKYFQIIIFLWMSLHVMKLSFYKFYKILCNCWKNGTDHLLLNLIHRMHFISSTYLASYSGERISTEALIITTDKRLQCNQWLENFIHYYLGWQQKIKQINPAISATYFKVMLFVAWI